MYYLSYIYAEIQNKIKKIQNTKTKSTLVVYITTEVEFTCYLCYNIYLLICVRKICGGFFPACANSALQRATCSALFISNDGYSIQYPAPGLAVSWHDFKPKMSCEPFRVIHEPCRFVFKLYFSFLALYCSEMAYLGIFW